MKSHESAMAIQQSETASKELGTPEHKRRDESTRQLEDHARAGTLTLSNTSAGTGTAQFLLAVPVPAI